MQNYNWEVNKAIVDRMYYSEKVLQITACIGGAFTASNLLYIQKGYFPAMARANIPWFWSRAIVFNVVALFVLLRPLQYDEMVVQWHKRNFLGKYLYTLTHMDNFVDAQGKPIELIAKKPEK
jgi:hypothetical protein